MSDLAKLLDFDISCEDEAGKIENSYNFQNPNSKQPTNNQTRAEKETNKQATK